MAKRHPLYKEDYGDRLLGLSAIERKRVYTAAWKARNKEELKQRNQEPCPECGAPKTRRAALCWPCSDRGSRNPMWKGDAAGADAGRVRARYIYAALRGTPCDDCGAPSVDLHHIDTNPLNNDRANIAVLCHRCHMIHDGRLAALIRRNKRL